MFKSNINYNLWFGKCILECTLSRFLGLKVLRIWDSSFLYSRRFQVSKVSRVQNVYRFPRIKLPEF
jgi:hypothetical protein